MSALPPIGWLSQRDLHLHNPVEQGYGALGARDFASVGKYTEERNSQLSAENYSEN